MRILFFLLAFGCIVSCVDRIGSKISSNEDKGIKEILKYYGGSCKYGVEFNWRDRKGEKIFWLKVQSNSLDSLNYRIELAAANVAYLFFRNLAEEKKVYVAIRSEVTSDNGTAFTFTYSTTELQTVVIKMKNVEELIQDIKNQSFDALKERITPDSTVVRYSADSLVSKVKQFESKLQKIQSFVPHGFRFGQIGNKHVLYISGLTKREKENYFITVCMNADIQSKEIYYFNYTI
jgi:hypothetical protein